MGRQKEIEKWRDPKTQSFCNVASDGLEQTPSRTTRNGRDKKTTARFPRTNGATRRWIATHHFHVDVVVSPEYFAIAHRHVVVPGVHAMVLLELHWPVVGLPRQGTRADTSAASTPNEDRGVTLGRPQRRAPPGWVTFNCKLLCRSHAGCREPQRLAVLTSCNETPLGTLLAAMLREGPEKAAGQTFKEGDERGTHLVSLEDPVHAHLEPPSGRDPPCDQDHRGKRLPQTRALRKKHAAERRWRAEPARCETA